MGDFAPKLAELPDDVLFGDVLERMELSKRDRSLVTVSALIALNRPDQLRGHLAEARDNGLKLEELVETITQAVRQKARLSARTSGRPAECRHITRSTGR